MQTFETYLNERLIHADIIDAFINWLDDKGIYYEYRYINFSTRVLFGVNKNYYAIYKSDGELDFYVIAPNNEAVFLDTVKDYDDIIWQNMYDKCENY